MIADTINHVTHFFLLFLIFTLPFHNSDFKKRLCYTANETVKRSKSMKYRLFLAISCFYLDVPKGLLFDTLSCILFLYFR